MAKAAAEIRFLVPGQLQPGTDAAPVRGRLKSSVRLGAQRSGGAGANAIAVSARPGEDLVLLTLSNGPTLVLHPESARELMLAQAGAGSRGAAPGGAVAVPAQLGWPGLEASASRGATRGWMGQSLLSAFEVLSGLNPDPAVDLATAAVTRKLDGQVEAGVYALPAGPLPASLKGSGLRQAQLPAAEDGGPLLVLIHGTFVDTISTFGKLWTQHPQTVRDLFQQYRGRVYALDHPTIGASPIANALSLVQALPAGARLHLLTHSRGGLVAEVLARACEGGVPDPAELALFDAPGHAQHRRDLLALLQQVKRKGLRLERVVRVACPARGTTLASKRLDAYLSVLQWGLQLAQVPVAPQLVDFLHEIARRRARPDELPGLEAMMPESPVVAWLNRGSQALPGELRVLAGDMEGDSLGSWLKTLLSDAFYWTDNDLVVQTRSMYGGLPRQPRADGAGARFLLERGAKVSHFNYFANDSSVQAIRRALLDAQPEGFAAIGPLSWAGQDVSGTRAARAVARSRATAAGATPAGQRPAVFVLPGILGSNLKLDGERLWLSFGFVNHLQKLAWDPATAARFEPDGPVGSSYDELIERLADSHEVIPFAYDWRRPLEDEARRLAKAVDAALAARAASGQPVRLLAHSMGGLLARTLRLEAPDTWRRLMARDGARLLMLGTPNGGSWAPMQTLSGDDTFGNALVAFGALFDNGGARKMMAGLPGFIQLQAGLLDPALGLDKAETWAALAQRDRARLGEQNLWHGEGARLGAYDWGAPPQAVLDQAVALRRRLDAQLDSLGTDAQKMLLVVGHAAFTPAGFVEGEQGLEYLDAPDGGDGRVTLASALLPGVRTWQLDVEHGKLPDVPEAFGAYLELLEQGQTERLPRCDADTGQTAAPAALQRSRPARGLQSGLPPSSPADVLLRLDRPAADDGPRGRRKSAAALRVAVLNADIKFVPLPLMFGHYGAMKLTGSEHVMDLLFEQALSRALTAGLYPDAPGTHQIFAHRHQADSSPLALARPRAALVVGLGEEGKLREQELAYTVRQAVLAYAQRLAELDGTAPAQFELASTLIGSGGTGISPGSAARAITQGALEANLRLQGSGWPQLGQLTLVELYLERAGDAWRALQLQEQATPGRLQLQGRVQCGTGALRRSLDTGYRGAAYDLIRALQAPGSSGAAPLIAYTLDSRRARTELRAQRAQAPLLRELVSKASNAANADTQIGRTLFNLLVPVELEPFFSGSGEMVLELDPGTAGLPWELLDTNPTAQAVDARPWALRCKLIRKLQLKDFRAQPRDASREDGVLVIGEPACDPAVYPPLDGARREAQAVAERLGAAAGGIAPEQLRALVDGNDAQSIINALFERPYRVVHIAGHGEPGANGGVVLSGVDTYLGANEIAAMRTVPELVFLNCCHLAGRDARQLLRPFDRAQFAANVAEALIRIGVRCVIAAGWAVEDKPAEQFASAFYAALLDGARFIEAVGAARSAAWSANRQGNTWAAYQCYGDPEWTWRRADSSGRAATPGLGDEFANVASPVSLTLALEAIATGCEFGGGAIQPQLDRLRYLESAFAPLWGGMGAVAEAFGAAYAGANELPDAQRWYRAAVEAADGSASFMAAEQLARLQLRRAQRLRKAPAARAALNEAQQQIDKLLTLQPTPTRAQLLGQVCKRLAVLDWQAGQMPAALAALDRAAAAEQDLAPAPQAGPPALRPLKLRLETELLAALVQGRLPRLEPSFAKALAEAQQQAESMQPDFGALAEQTELLTLAALARGQLAPLLPGLGDSLRGLRARVTAPALWEALHEQARYTLLPYLAIATAEERQAAAQLLALLRPPCSAEAD